MKLVLLGLCLLGVVVVIEGKHHGSRHDEDEGPMKDLSYGDYYNDWETCHYVEDGQLRKFKCRSCCGKINDQYCCDDDYYDDSHEDDKRGKFGKSHKVILVVVVIGSLAAVMFVIVSISCVCYMKNKQQQSSHMRTDSFSGVVNPTAPTGQAAGGDYGVPIMQPGSEKSPLPNVDLYTGQNKANMDINTIMSAPPPYNTKY